MSRSTQKLDIRLSVVRVSNAAKYGKSRNFLPDQLFPLKSCVGMYFPAIGALRSKYVPDDNKSVVLSLFGVPLNALVVLACLFVKQLSGALGVSSAALAIATGCMAKLRSIARKEAGEA